MVFTVSVACATIEAVHLQGIAALSVEDVDYVDARSSPFICILQIIADREHVLVIGCAFASAEVEHSLNVCFWKSIVVVFENDSPLAYNRSEGLSPLRTPASQRVRAALLSQQNDVLYMSS